MAQKHHVYLIPGFFGFADLGGITYFHHVRKFITAEFAAKGIEAVIHEVKTLPTASIRRRAGRLLETVGETALDDAPIHLVGHSTGGLDARLFVSPQADVDVDCPYQLADFAKRVQTVVTLATPHYGTPMASFFTSVLGAEILYLLSVATIYTMQFGKVPMMIMIAIGELITKVDDYLGFEDSILDGLYEKLFDDFDDERQAIIKAFLEEIKSDQTLVGQLTPGGIELFNATYNDNPTTRYGSVAMKAREPGFKSLTEIGLDPYRQASHVIYRFLHWLVADEDGKYPDLSPAEKIRFETYYGAVPDQMQSDGIVPTRSQVWGELFHVGKGDHLDVCGHFDDLDHDPPHYDWIATGTSFGQDEFEVLWKSVCTFILR